MDTTLRPVFDFLFEYSADRLDPDHDHPSGHRRCGKGSHCVSFSAFIPLRRQLLYRHQIRQKVHIWVGQTFGASKLRILFKVAIPSALPHIFTGLKVSLNSSWGCLVAAEMLGPTAVWAI